MEELEGRLPRLPLELHLMVGSPHLQDPLLQDPQPPQLPRPLPRPLALFFPTGIPVLILQNVAVATVLLYQGLLHALLCNCMLF